MPCLECQSPIAASKRGHPKRFCSKACKAAMHNRAMRRGAQLYYLFRAMRRDRAKAKELNIWTEMCRLELFWNDEDEGRKTWIPPELVLADIANHDKIPTTNLYLDRRAPQ